MSNQIVLQLIAISGWLFAIGWFVAWYFVRQVSNTGYKELGNLLKFCERNQENFKGPKYLTKSNVLAKRFSSFIRTSDQADRIIYFPKPTKRFG